MCFPFLTFLFYETLETWELFKYPWERWEVYICSLVYSVVYGGLIRKQKPMCVLALQHLLMWTFLVPWVLVGACKGEEWGRVSRQHLYVPEQSLERQLACLSWSMPVPNLALTRTSFWFCQQMLVTVASSKVHFLEREWGIWLSVRNSPSYPKSLSWSAVHSSNAKPGQSGKSSWVWAIKPELRALPWHPRTGRAKSERSSEERAGQVRNALPHWVSSPLVIPLSFPCSDFCVCVRVSLPSLSAQLLSHSCLAPPSVSLVWLPPTSFVLLGCSASLLCADSSGSKDPEAAAITPGFPFSSGARCRPRSPAGLTRSGSPLCHTPLSPPRGGHG